MAAARGGRGGGARRHLRRQCLSSPYGNQGLGALSAAKAIGPLCLVRRRRRDVQHSVWRRPHAAGGPVGPCAALRKGGPPVRPRAGTNFGVALQEALCGSVGPAGGAGSSRTFREAARTRSFAAKRPAAAFGLWVLQALSKHQGAPCPPPLHAALGCAPRRRVRRLHNNASVSIERLPHAAGGSGGGPEASCECAPRRLVSIIGHALRVADRGRAVRPDARRRCRGHA